jgi:DNA-binding NtrC family response regulator
VKGTTTVSLAGDSLVDDDTGGTGEVPGLVIAWSAEEPHRVGEVMLFRRLGRALVLGRGADSGSAASERGEFVRQRPHRAERTAALEGRAISRQQLLVRPFAAGLEVESIGRCPTLINGVLTAKAAVTPGDTVHLKGQLLMVCVMRARSMRQTRYFLDTEWGPFGEADELGMLGESPEAWRLRDRVAFAAKSATHVLLQGESGTGKELAARAIHHLSKRRSKPFIARNAATFPATLIDAELFGNVKNYPNPGMPERPGLVGQASGGTLFLDEIAELPEEMQAHLLRVLDADGEYQRLGEATTRRADFRLVGATNRPEAALKHDLLARLTVRVELPPLDARREDIPLLVRHLLLRATEASPEIGGRFVREVQGRREARIDPTLLEDLMHRTYPSNMRELDALLWRAMESSPRDTLSLTDELRATATGETAARRAREADDIAEAPTPILPAARVEPTAESIRASIEREGNLARAARALGLPSRYALYRLMRKHGIEHRGTEE